MMGIGQSPIDDILFKQVAIGDENIDSVKFADARATGAEVDDPAQMSVDIDKISDLDSLLCQKN